MWHLKDNGGNALGIGHTSDLDSIYDNLQLYPKAMPWLFPYELGGIGNNNGEAKTPDKAHRRVLLLYYDKRFQTDPLFPLLVFNHTQIQQSVTGG